MTESHVRKILEDHNLTWEEFLKFMEGQTCGLNQDGTIEYYSEDVERFITGLPNND